MSKFVDVAGSDRAMLYPLFCRHTHLRAVIESVLEGELGTASVNRVAPPQTARLVLGVYTFLAGDSRGEAARAFVQQATGPCELIVAGDPSWESLIARVHGERIERRTMDAFSPDAVNLAHLRELVHCVPEGVAIGPITESVAQQLGPELEPNRVSIFGSPERFVDRGIGVYAQEAGSIVAAATSYAASSKRVEVAVATHPDQRRRGLAVSVGAAMLIRCIEKGLEPHWTAGNSVSAKVALKLGFTLSGKVPVLFLRAF